ncbi:MULTISPECIES: M90 family metallopeptidase [unclassified Cupriavidus]|uniref:M90 family metallopeptidase n=1 Tax=unclassified Cupriavidus TaxID=2640874 RepID=UPI001C008DD1|nr:MULTISPECIES: M90 family metallopeptidase [unclassified Cupriavidus]MCA3182820.1 zinc-dependent peptidase [Cupriavidus sp.]MCA3191532.1 zinc-dependent peptidase [Cupriavidus sp.]MCA3199873.1 zinc-dependent peptidase [Cupriavidus sp.]MCA3201707.1 zinc-dependent peptidase [Cupriavidus sp.]MCA3206772.1 zinc-dependent peptidase [Cupriavidus sp.]
MFGKLSSYLRARSRERKLAHYAIPDDLWTRTVAALPYVQRYGADDLAALRELATLFIASKEYSTAHELELTDEMVVGVAVQACVPILKLGIEWYRGWHGIVLYPGEFLIRKTVEDDIGLVHGVEEEASGEAWENGPVILSWQDVNMPGSGLGNGSDSYNVVIHEFAHKLDMLDGEPDGVPPFSRVLHPGIDAEQWAETLLTQYDVFADACEAVPDAAWDDPERLPPRLRVIDPYGCEAPSEFFAVASEAFFVDPAGLRAHWPALYKVLKQFYRQDPAASGA